MTDPKPKRRTGAMLHLFPPRPHRIKYATDAPKDRTVPARFPCAKMDGRRVRERESSRGS